VSVSLALDGSASRTLSSSSSTSSSSESESSVLVIRNVPSGFHLLTTHCTCNGTGSGNNGGRISIPVGLLMLFDDHDSDDDNNSNDEFVVRRWNPALEELNGGDDDDDDDGNESSGSGSGRGNGNGNGGVDNVTKNNLRRAIDATIAATDGHIHGNNTSAITAGGDGYGYGVDPSRIIPYHLLLENTKTNNESGILSSASALISSASATSVVWREHLTNFISRTVLSHHALSGEGDKIVPGAFKADKDIDADANVDANANANAAEMQIEQLNKVKAKSDKGKDGHPHQDGVTLQYPSIPCLQYEQVPVEHKEKDSIIKYKYKYSYSHGSSHEGTKRYLTSLSPQQRTAFFMNQNHRQNNKQNHLQSDVDMDMNLDMDMDTPADKVFHHVLRTYYHNAWQDLMGDLQLSFCVFLSCSCLASLEHWRDTIYMLSLVSHHTISSPASTSASSLDDGNVRLYYHLMDTIMHQLMNFDGNGNDNGNTGILHDDDFAEGNVFLPAIQKICHACKQACACNMNVNASADGNSDAMFQKMNQRADALLQWMAKKFDLVDENVYKYSGSDGGSGSGSSSHVAVGKEYNNKMDSYTNTTNNGNKITLNDNLTGGGMPLALDLDDSNMAGTMPMWNTDADDDEDGPTIVAFEEVQASIDRQSLSHDASAMGDSCQSGQSNTIMVVNRNNNSNDTDMNLNMNMRARTKYPFLFAAMEGARMTMTSSSSSSAPWQCKEDTIMTCARILEEQKDVTLVREAAAYLEEVEAFR